MKKYYVTLYLFSSLFLLQGFFSGCSSSKKMAGNGESVILDPVTITPFQHDYKAAATRTFDLIHTQLDVSFDWENQYLNGKATLLLTPYFYATHNLELDAKGMEIHSVEMLHDDTTEPLLYTYNDTVLSIRLGKKYRKGEQIKIQIQYTAKPEELGQNEDESMSAIRDSKGLYFIDPLQENSQKPTQIWTQGEPEDNSVWFPTIDNPNERCTQEIYITVDSQYIAMSNGTLVDKQFNDDGTTTWYWKQDQPHAPYLFMMTIGEFAEIKDMWNDISVNYYVEEKYKDVARQIFGNTPEMMTYFSDLLQVYYPWDKYWQVCVRDYVSGAMENTSAVIFGEFMQRDSRELLDENYEDIVAHELFHHWFGDLVTCESWANLPLNESFATYGEVLWKEYKYGPDETDLKRYSDMSRYFSEAQEGKQEDLIRYHHDAPRDMFDAHSYEKGSCVLHMLRHYVGDTAFFESLELYLNDNAYSAVEIHNLRLAFEEITGQDLNWFFNQWFLSAGHPVLDIDYVYTDSTVVVNIQQDASAEAKLIYKIPLDIDIYEGNTYRREQVILEEKEGEYEFSVDSKPFLVQVDPEHVLLAEIYDNKTKNEWIFQYMNARNFLDKLYALDGLFGYEEDQDIVDVYEQAISDPFWYIQEIGIEFYPLESDDQTMIDKLKKIATEADKSGVRYEAIYRLGELEEEKYKPLFIEALKDSSYLVNAAALENLASIDTEAAFEQAKSMEGIENYDLLDAIGYIYSEYGTKDDLAYFESYLQQSENEYGQYYAIYYYSKLIGRLLSKEAALHGLSFIKTYASSAQGELVNRVSVSAVERIQRAFQEEMYKIEDEIKQSTGRAQRVSVQNRQSDILFVIDRAEQILSTL